MKKSNLVNRLVIIIAVLAVAAVIFGPVLAESYTASNMRLLRYEGDVAIDDASGNPRFIMQNARFSSGESIRTGETSLASIGLDAEKILTMDEKSRVEFLKQGNALTMTLTDGQLLLDVQEKLDDNESLDIQTSTMAVGIRGTIVFVTDTPIDRPSTQAAADQGRVSTLGVLEGTAQLTYMGSDGVPRSIPVSAGQLASVEDADGDGQPDTAPKVTPLVDADLSRFVDNQLRTDNTLYRRVEDACPQIFDDIFINDESWSWEQPVTLVAQSASKLYDGLPLTRPTDVLVYGLPECFSIRVSASGSQTDAGESDNPIGAYSIYNTTGEDVTAHFSRIEMVAGRLTVDPAPLTVWTGSAEKVYDGTPLTNPETALRSVPGYEQDLTPWRNTAYVFSESVESETLYGLCGVTWVHGTNPLTGETREIELLTGQKLTVYLHSEEGKQSIEFKIEDADETELPEEVLRLYADNPDLLAQACADAGWDADVIARLIAALPGDNRSTVQQEGLEIDRGATDRLMVNCTNVRITIDTEITSYDGRALGSEEARFTPVAIDESIRVTATGSQTEPGQSPNTYVIDWGSANPGNYILSEELGTLIVWPAAAPEDKEPDKEPEKESEKEPEKEPEEEPDDEPEEEEPSVTLTAGSAEKVYDGTPLVNQTVSATGLPKGYTVSAEASGSQTEAGSGDNPISAYRIYNAAGADVTASFSKVTVVSGTLTVEPLKLSVDLGGKDDVTYDGQSYVPSAVTATYQNGEHAGESVTGERIRSRALSPIYVFSLFTGDQITVTLETEGGSGADAGTYTLKGQCEFSAGNGGSFSLEYTNVTFTITPATLTITTPSASKTYDGTPLTCSEDVEVKRLIDGDEITVTYTGSQTDAGSSDNTYTINWGEVNKDNYTVSDELGTLTVDPISLTFDMNGGYSTTYTNLTHNPRRVSATLGEGEDAEEAEFVSGGKVYDNGNPICYRAVFNLLGEDQVELTSTGPVNAGENQAFSNSVKFNSGNKDNYKITYDNNTVTVNKLHVNVYLNPNEYWVTYNGEEQSVKAATHGSGIDGIYESDGIEPYVGGYYEWMTLEPAGENIWNAFGSIKGDVIFTMTVTGGGTNVGWYPLTAEFSGNDNIDFTVDEDFAYFYIDSAPLAISTESASKPYDGTPLTCETVTVKGLMPNDQNKGFSVKATGSQTDVGSSDNTYEIITWGDVNQDNYYNYYECDYYYETGEDWDGLGTLTVTPLGVTFDMGGWKDAYDANWKVPKTASGTYAGGGSVTLKYEDTVMVHGYWELPAKAVSTFELIGGAQVRLTADLSGMNSGYKYAANAGTYTLPCEYKFLEGSEDKAANYSISLTNNVMTVTPAQVVLRVDGGTVPYDGALHQGTLTATHDEGTCTIYSGSDYYSVYPQFNGSGDGGGNDGLKVTLTGGGTEPDTYDVSCTFEHACGSGTIPENISVTVVPGKLTIEGDKTEITFTAESASKEYDGEPLEGEVSVEGLPDDCDWAAEASGSQTIVGSCDTKVITSSIKIYRDGEDVTKSFSNIKTVDGKLEVTKNATEITVTAGSASKEYDGTPLTCETVTVDGLPEGFTFEGRAEGSRTDPGEGTNKVAFYAIYKDGVKVTEYFSNIKTVDGTLTIIPDTTEPPISPETTDDPDAVGIDDLEMMTKAAPRADTSDPQTDTPEPQDDTPEPQDDTSDPQDDTSDPQADASDPQTDTPEPQADTPEPQVDAPEPQADAPEPQPDPKPQADIPEPQASLPAPEESDDPNESKDDLPKEANASTSEPSEGEPDSAADGEG